MRRLAALALFLLLAAPPAWAGLPPGLTIDGEAVVAAVIDGDTVALDDGSEVRLVGLQAPKRALGRAGFEPWPLSEEAAAALTELALGRRVALAYGGAREDRYGRRLAHLLRDDGLWLQGEMLARGLARVYGFPDNRTGIAEMLAVEEAARAAGRGIWSHSWYAVRTPEGLADDLDSFQLVEGVVLEAAEVDGRLFLNFGTNWDEDFTIVVPPAEARGFAAEGFDALALAGRRVRVRGWVQSRRGPMIEVRLPEQIERLDTP